MIEALKIKYTGVHTYRLGNVIRKVYFGDGTVFQNPKKYPSSPTGHYFDYEQHFYTKNVQEHINIMNKVMPGYILQHGYFSKNAYFIDSKFFLGTCLNEVPGTWRKDKRYSGGIRFSRRFIKKFRNFCIESAGKTFPYSHGDWTPDNVLEHNGQWTLVDWDWVGKRSILETQQIINQRLKQVFGYEVDIVQKRELLFMEKF